MARIRSLPGDVACLAGRGSPTHTRSKTGPMSPCSYLRRTHPAGNGTSCHVPGRGHAPRDAGNGRMAHRPRRDGPGAQGSEKVLMGVIDQTNCPVKTGSIYPEPYASQMAGRSSLRLGQAAGLTQFGANLVILQPGARSSLRHWHRAEDEFVMVTEGELVLRAGRGRVRHAPRRLRRLEGRRHQRPLLPQPHRPRGPLPRRRLARRRTRSPPTPTSTSCWR